MVHLFLRVLDCNIEVSCSDKETSNILASCYSAFLKPRDDCNPVVLKYRVTKSEETNSWSLETRSGVIECPRLSDLLYDFEKDMTISVQLIRNELLFVHGAVVADRNRCGIISGASGAGKSTLCWALCHEGFSYMSDELAPIRLADNHVEAYPHSLCMKNKPIGRYPLPIRYIDASTTLHVPVEEIPAKTVNNAVPLKFIVFLSGEDNSNQKPVINKIESGEGAARLYANSLNQLAHPRAGLLAVAELAQSIPCYSMRRVSVSKSTKLIASLIVDSNESKLAEDMPSSIVAHGLT